MVKVEEKIALARKIGLDEWVGIRSWETEKAKTVAELTDMKFRITNTDELEARLSKFYIKSKAALATSILAFLPSFLTFALAYGMKPSADGVSAYVVAVSFLALPIVFFFTVALGKTRMETMAMRYWKDNIPYGGLLAMQEAMAKGIDDFTISFPVTERRARLKADPIICGEFNGVMVEVFAWDDGKIYE